VLQVHDGPFVPEGHPLAEIDRRWRRLCEANSAYFDGRIYHVLGVHRNGYGGASIHVADCAYRFHAVQRDGFDLGVRPLGTKAFTFRDDCVLIGRRSRNVAHYPGLWEFAPGGVVNAGDRPGETILAELKEETGLRAGGEPVAIGVVYDPEVLCWEVVFRLDAAAGPLAPATPEYDALEWRPPSDLPADLSPVSRQMLPLLNGREGGPIDARNA